MAREYFSILGLAPGEYTPREITRRFQALRAHLDRITTPDTDALRRQRDDLYLAYATLRLPRRQSEYLYALQHGTTPQRELQRLIGAALEDDLLRHSRREAILAEGRRIGLSDFHTQLLIAEVQFSHSGDEADTWHPARVAPLQSASIAAEQQPASAAIDDLASPPIALTGRTRRALLRFAVAGALATVIFVAAERWLTI